MHRELQEKIVAIINSVDLPKMGAVLDESRRIAASVRIGRTAFMEKYDVSSELEYKRRCIKEGRIMYHAHIGMNTWAETAAGLRGVYEFAEANHFRLDRAGICLDRRMSLPKDLRKSAPQESGPYLETEEDWMQVGQAVPIQPHMGDFIIGFPASTENAVAALRAGVTTVGNLSQFFAHEAPMWKRRDITTIETVKAFGVLGALREKGTLAHSYLDDGFGALFLDCSTTAGWAYLERYIIEELLGAKLAHCVGGLVSDPVKRSGWVFALDEIHDHDCIGSMFFGNTISAQADPDSNRFMTAEYLIWDIMTQLACPTGHAVLPVPLTEAIRAPSLEEICEVQLLGREIERIARGLYPFFSFRASKQFANKICTQGKKIFDDSLAFFSECGVDIKDAVQLLYVLKSIGPRNFERTLNPSVEDSSLSQEKTRTPSDIFTLTLSMVEKWSSYFMSQSVKEFFAGKTILLASTDVHEHGIVLISRLLKLAGANLINIGAEKNPDEVVTAASEQNAEMIFISTHNGMALEYSRNLLDEMEEHNMILPVCMGGVINQNVDEGNVPVDVSEDLRRMGIGVVNNLESIVDVIVSMKEGKLI